MRSLTPTTVLFFIITTLAGSASVMAMPDDCPVSGIKPAVFEQTQTYQGKTEKYNWYLSPCLAQAAPGQKPCTPADGYFQEFDVPTQNGGACLFSMTEVKSPWTEQSNPFSGQKGYVATFGNSINNNVAEINIICDASAGNLETNGDTIATDDNGAIRWAVTLKSNMACGNTVAPGAPPTPPPNTPVPIPTTTPAPPVPPGQTTATPVPFSTPTPPSPPQEKKKGGCGGGCAFLIIIFIGPLVYVLIFVAWNFKNGKRGKELAPHPEFWMSVPGLIKDGCIFFAQKVCGLVDKIRGKGGSGGGNYNEV